MAFQFTAFDATDRNEIRWMLDLGYTQDDIPDEIIDSDIVFGAAKAWADRQVDAPDTPTADQEATYKRSIKLRAASILCGTKAQLLRSGAGGASEGVETIGWVQRAQKLERDSILEIEDLIDDGLEVDPRPAAKVTLFVAVDRC